MSRTVIAAVVAAVIAAVTAIAYFVTSSSFEQRVRNDADGTFQRAYPGVDQLTQLESIVTLNKAERLAAEPEFAAALMTDSADERQRQSLIGFQKFTADERQGDVRPDIIALVDAGTLPGRQRGNILAMNGVPTVVPKQWQKDVKPGDPPQTVIPALNVVLGKKVIISDIWNNGAKGMMKIGVAPVINPDVQPTAANPDSNIIGAIVVAYSQTAQEAQKAQKLLGADIAYVDGKSVVATSFSRGGTEEDTAKAHQLNDYLATPAAAVNGKQRFTIEGTEYIGASIQMPRKATKPWPSDYPAPTASVWVLAPIVDTGNTAGTVKLFILLLGGGGLAIAMLGLYLSNRRLVAQVDQIEQGVTDIINGNVDRTFRPVGLELDGLANGLNVMLARLLGRPEPGEEEFDDDGNPIILGRVEFEESDEPQATKPDPDLAALAQESEPDYYKRVYTEYLAARKATGNPDEVSFENFIAKLKVNEGKLKAQYQCRAVRFRIVTKDNKVTLKPVPIFA